MSSCLRDRRQISGGSHDRQTHARRNEQINKELFSSYLYLSMATYFAKWLNIQAGEEREHAMKLYEHLEDRGVDYNTDPKENPQGLSF